LKRDKRKRKRKRKRKKEQPMIEKLCSIILIRRAGYESLLLA